MSNPNPKAFYNQPDYSAGSSGHSSSAPQVVHKPDEITAADFLPPPPYSPDHTGRNSEGGSSGYGSLRNSSEQQQHGLLAPALPRNVNNSNAVSPSLAKRSWNPQSDYQQLPTSQPFVQEAGSAPSSSFVLGTRQAYQDQGCCKKWCKYMIAIFLLWLVIYMYSSKIFFSPPPYDNGRYGCNNGCVQWQDLPSTIEFNDNIELVIEGRVSNGLVTVVPLEDRHGGSILSDIQVYPPSLQEKIKFEIQENGSSYNNRGESTKLYIQMPPQFENEDQDCISIKMEIRLPYAASQLLVNVKNLDIDVQPFVKDVDTVDIKTSNGMIHFGQWSGESIKLSTQNSEIKVDRLTSGGSVYLENTNAPVYLTENVDAKRIISVQNSNGAIEALGPLSAEDSVNVETSNGFVKLSQVSANSVSLTNANHEIQVDYIRAKARVLAKSSNGPIMLSIGETKNNQVNVGTSNGDINLYMTEEYEGSFVMRTSHGEVSIENEQDIEYQDDLDELKRGYRGRRGKGDLIAQTSNGNIYVAFNIK